MGFGLAGDMLTQYVYVLELVGPTKRTMAGKLTDFGWTLGNVATVFFAYFIRDWRVLLIITSACSAVFLFSYK